MKVRLPKGANLKISSADDIYSIMQQILLRETKISRSQERMWVIGLDNKNVILYIELVALGTTNSVGVKVRDILRMAIQKVAMGIILVHNHPSGSLKPSECDIALTERIKHGCYVVSVDLLDHLIVTEKEYYSFKTAKKLK